MPNKKELLDLWNDGAGDCYSTYFLGCADIWSSTSVFDWPSAAFFLDKSNEGLISASAKSASKYARCVRFEN